MAEKEKKAEAAAEKPAEKVSAEKSDGKGKKGGLLSKTPILVGGAMLLEGVVLIAGVYVLRGGGGPAAAQGAELVAPAEGGEGAAKSQTGSAEVKLVEFRAQNKQSGRTFLYDVSMSVMTPAKDEAQVKQLISDREALIQDRIRTIIAEMDPDKLAGGAEPGMETLRRQVKHQMDLILGDGKVQEILISRFIPFRTDF